MKALVTGGGGFVGFTLAQMLHARGDEVITVARGDYPKLAALGVRHVRADLAEPSTMAKGGAARDALHGVDVVFHVAAKAGVWGAPDDYERSNVAATQNLLDACAAAGVARFVFTSSPSVTFSGGDAVNADESLPYPRRHLYDYGRTKAEAERRVLAANGTPHKRSATGSGGVLLTCALRPHLVYGPGDPHILPRMIARARAGRLAWIGRPSTLVDVTYVDNAAHAHLLAADALAADAPTVGKRGPAGKAYFISQGNPVHPAAWVNRILVALGLPEVRRRIPLGVAYGMGAVMELAWRILRLRGEPLMTRFLAAQLGTSHYYDLTAARRDLGYEPIVDDDTAHARTVAWLREEVAAGRV